MLERVLKYPGFLYEIQGKYYYLGKWICKECTNTNAADCGYMYRMNRKEKDEAETNMYFQKLRAFSDFALEVPYNPDKIKSDFASLISGLTENQQQSLARQIDDFEEDYPKYCKKTL